MATNNVINQAGPTPSFLVTLDTTINSVAGNNSTYKILFDTVQFDRDLNYSLSTGKFIAPFAGVYCFNSAVCYLSNPGGGVSAYTYFLVNSIIYLGTALPTNTGLAGFAGPNGYLSMQAAVTVHLNALDWVEVWISGFGGSKNDSIVGNSIVPATQRTYFCGYLLNFA